MKKAAATWGGEWWKLGGGGTVWDAIVYDPKTDLVYFGTGNGTPWNRISATRKAATTCTSPRSSRSKPTPASTCGTTSDAGDTWDYDAVSPMMIVDLTIDGKKQHVLCSRSKNGFFYMIDAATGKLLRAEPFTVNWADGVDMKTGRPRVKPEARYGSTDRGVDVRCRGFRHDRDDGAVVRAPHLEPIRCLLPLTRQRDRNDALRGHGRHVTYLPRSPRSAPSNSRSREWPSPGGPAAAGARRTRRSPLRRSACHLPSPPCHGRWCASASP